MKDPESYLELLNTRFLKLLNYVDILDLGKQGELERIKEIFRKTCISRFLYDRYVISIAGLQGAGKTTIVNQLYGLKKEEILPENLGVGEQIPILITESEVNEPKTVVYKLIKNSDEIKFEKTEVTHGDFKKISMHPTNEDIFLELFVPLKYFNDFGVSLMLLPGFEENKDDYWQFLTKHSLVNSANFAFVIDESRYAKEFNQKLIDEYLNEFEGFKPIFLITKSDESKDKNKSLSEKFQKDRKISDNEIDRIICTGDTDELRKIWIPKLVKAIGKYRNSSISNKRKKIKYLSKILDNEIFELVDSIEENSTRRGQKDDIEFEKKLYRIINPLKKSIEELRKEYANKLKENLNLFIQKPKEDMKDYIVEKDFIDKIKTFFIGPNAKDLSEFEKQINKYWNTSNSYSIDNLWLKVTTDISIKENILLTGVKKIEKFKLEELSEEEKKDLIVYNNNLINQDILRNLEILFNSKNNEISKLSEIEFNNSLLPAIKLIPALILENIRLNKLFPKYLNKLNENNNSRESSNNFIDELNFSISVHSKIIAAFGVILGVDGAADGKIDSIPNLLNALGIELSERASMMLSASLAALGVAALIRSMVISINKNDISQIGEAKAAFDDLNQKTLDSYLDKYDETMDFFVKYLINRIKESYHVDNNFARQINLDQILSDIKEIRTKVRENINENVKILGE